MKKRCIWSLRVTYALYLQLVGKRVHSQLLIRNNWTLFASSYGSNVSRYWSKSALFNANFGWTRTSPTNFVGIRKLEWLPFHKLSKYPQYFYFFSSQSTRVTYGQTKLRSQDRASTAAARGKNTASSPEKKITLKADSLPERDSSHSRTKNRH